VEVRFEDPAAGFFLAREAEGPGAGVLGSEPAPAPGPRADARAFTLLSAGPATLRASLGPFLARQTVAPPGGLPSNASLGPGGRSFDLSAHLVTREVRKDSPVLRVLFHTGQRGPASKKKGVVCILLTAALGNRSVSTACAPGGRDGSCLGQLTLPAGWWPGLATTANQAGTKQPKIVALVSYRVTVGRRGECGSPGPAGALVVGGERTVGGVPLEGARAGYQQVAGDETLHLLIPQAPLYPGSRLYVPVFLEQPRAGPPVAVLAVKCRARRGVRIAGVEEASKDWTLRVEVNSRGSTGTVTAFRRDAARLDSSRREG
jgi:transmembrane protein 132